MLTVDRWFKNCLLVLVSLALIGVVTLPYYRQFQQKRFVNQARQFIAQNDFRSAFTVLRQTLHANPKNLEAARLMAQLADALHSPLTWFCRWRVAEIDPALRNRLGKALCHGI